MQIGNPLMFTIYMDSDRQILFLWACLFYTGFRRTSYSGLRWCPIAAGVNKSKAANNDFKPPFRHPRLKRMPESSHLTFSPSSASSPRGRANGGTLVQKQSNSWAPRPPTHTLSEGTGTKLRCVNNQGRGEGGGGGVKYLLSFTRPPTKCCKDPATKIICHDSSVRQNINKLSALLKRTSGKLRAVQMFSQVVFYRKVTLLSFLPLPSSLSWLCLSSLDINTLKNL